MKSQYSLTNMKTLFEILSCLNRAKSIDIISTNGDIIIGQPANIILAAANRKAKIRFAQSVHESAQSNITIDKILFEFGSNLVHVPIYNNHEYSCLIIDGVTAFDSQTYTSEIASQNIPICDSTIANLKFTEIWNNNVNDPKIRCIKQLLREFESLQFTKGEYSFRGQVNADWPLTPTLLRTFENNEPQIEASYLKPLFHREYLPFIFTIDPIGYLANCQHYGLKTRLLDFSRDFLIGLFFSCYDKNDEYSNNDGKLTIIENKQFPLLKIQKQAVSTFQGQITEDNIEIFKARLLNEFPCIFEPMIKNPRIRIQDGLLILFPFSKNDKNYLSLEDHIKNWNKSITEDENKYWIGHKLVDRRFKKYILKQLDEEFAINNQSVFIHSDRSDSMGQLIDKLVTGN